MRYVAPEAGYKEAENCKWLMDSIVYMPIHSGQDDKDFRETVERTIECYYKLTEYLNNNKEILPPVHEMNKKLIERAKL